MALPPVKSTPAGLHLTYLDSLRGLAAVYVVIHHALYLELSKFPLFSVFGYGIYAVQFFIILSGFCLMLPVVRNGGKLPTSCYRFFVRRGFRILPTYYIALLVCIVWSVTIRSDRQVISIPDVVSHLLMIHDAIPQFVTSINSVFWSIGVEWRIYFFFPALLLAWRFWGAFPTTILATISSAIVAVILGTVAPDRLTSLWFHFLGLFSMGMLAADLCFSSKEAFTPFLKIRQRYWHLGTLLCIALIVLITWMDPMKLWPRRPTGIAIGVATGTLGAIILVCITQTRFARVWRFLHWKPMVFLGRISYSLYLTHTVFLSMTYSYIVDPLGLQPLSRALLGAALGTLLSILGSYLFFLGAEKPFLKAGRVKRDPSPTAPLPASAIVGNPQIT